MSERMIFYIIGMVVGFVLGAGGVRAQGLQGLSYTDGKDCILTRNPPIAGRINDQGMCQAMPLTGNGAVTITATPAPHCEQGWTLVADLAFIVQTPSIDRAFQHEGRQSSS